MNRTLGFDEGRRGDLRQQFDLFFPLDFSSMYIFMFPEVYFLSAKRLTTDSLTNTGSNRCQ